MLTMKAFLVMKINLFFGIRHYRRFMYLHLSMPLQRRIDVFIHDGSTLRFIVLHCREKSDWFLFACLRIWTNTWLSNMPQIQSKKPKLLIPYFFWLRKGQMCATKTQWRTYKLAMLPVHSNTRGQHDCLQVLHTISCSKTRDICQTVIMSIHGQHWYFDCLF